MNRLYRIGEMLSLDPRTKLFLTIAFAVVWTLTTDLAALGIESAVVALMVMALGLRGAWLKTLRVLLPMTTFLVVVVFFSFDLATALAGALRLIAMTTVFFIFFHTTAPEDLANGGGPRDGRRRSAPASRPRRRAGRAAGGCDRGGSPERRRRRPPR